MARVDPDDDSIQRFVVWHYRFDPGRHERRNVVVAAFDNDEEFKLDVERRTEELGRAKHEGDAEMCERISGVVLPPHANAEARRGRTSGRAVRAAARSAKHK